MRENIQDLLNALEKKRDQLYKLASGAELTSIKVVAFSCELDELVNKVYMSIIGEQPSKNTVEK